MTARVCHDHFTRVVIVEREGWLNTEDARITHGWTQEHRRTNVIQYYSLNGQAKHFVIFADFVTSSQLYSASRSESSNIFFLTLKSNALRPRFRVYNNTFLNKTDNPSSIAPGIAQLVWYGHEICLPRDVWHTVPKTMFASRRGYETLLRRLVLDKARYPNIEQIAGTVTEIHPDKENSSRIGSISVRKEDGDIVKLSGECFVGGLLSFDLYSVAHSVELRLYWVYARSNMARQSRIWEAESSGQQGAATQ